jgi:tetratricopeptide (TPR) repeat protein
MEIDDTSWLVDEESLEQLVYELSDLRLKDLATATVKTQSLLDISRAHENTRTTAVLVGVLASCYRWDSRLFEAYKLAKHSAELLESLEMPKYLVLSLNVLGLCYKDMADPTSAFEVLLKASQIAREFRFNREATLTSLNLAYVHASQNQREDAIAQYLNVLDQYSQHCKPFEITVILNNLASNYIEIKRWDDALIYADKALEAVDQEGNKYLYSRILTNKAMVLAWKGDVNKALEITDYVQTLCKDSNRISALPSTWYGLAEVFFNAGLLTDAQDLLKKALDLSLTLEGNPYHKQILEMMARVRYGLGDYEGAFESLQTACDLASSQNKEQIEATVRSALLRQQVESWEAEAAMLRQLNLELVAVHEQTEADHRANTELLISIANEVHGPIRTVIELADELLALQLPVEQQERVQSIRSYCANLRTIVSDAMKSGIEAGP